MLKEGNDVISGLIQRQLPKWVTQKEIKSSIETCSNALTGMMIV